MNKIRNKVQLIGNLGNDPEIMNYENDKKRARFSLATTDYYKNGKDEKKTETHWHNIVAWGNTASVAEKLLTKGCQVAVNGKLVSRSYEDKEGTKKYISEVVVNEILLLNSRKKEENNLPF